MTEALCDSGSHLLEAYVFKSFDFVLSPVTCFNDRKGNWALGSLELTSHDCEDDIKYLIYSAYTQYFI